MKIICYIGWFAFSNIHFSSSTTDIQVMMKLNENNQSDFCFSLRRKCLQQLIILISTRNKQVNQIIRTNKYEMMELVRCKSHKISLAEENIHLSMSHLTSQVRPG